MEEIMELDIDNIDLAGMAKYIEDIKLDFLFGWDDDDLTPEAKEYFLIALSHMELASRHFQLADIINRRKLR